MKKILFILIAVSGILPLASRAAVINGVLVDSQDTTELIEASVRLLMANKDSTMVKGTTTDMNGVFNIKGVKAGKYLLRFSYLGYNDVIKHVTVGEDGRDVNIGVVKMDPNTIMLKEAVVVGLKSPITVKEDTIEFNADTYKTQANAVVEDLLKRLPGVEVGSDGKITANGKEVKKILIDGKEFFSDDPTVASKNIPADMINKLQVIDRKSDLARLTGVDDGDDETVINLTVKKGMNNRRPLCRQCDDQPLPRRQPVYHPGRRQQRQQPGLWRWRFGTLPAIWRRPWRDHLAVCRYQLQRRQQGR